METHSEPDSLAMAGIYLHLPFCQRKCGYCDFYSIQADSDEIEEYVRLLCEEMKLREAAFPYWVRTVYLGGGTPSLVPGGSIRLLLDSLNQFFNLAEEAEITIEVNPGTITFSVWNDYKSAGINRISLGVQSFHDRELKLLGRIHQSDEAKKAFEDARRFGFENIGIDLIYGLPGQTEGDWGQTLNQAIGLDPEHVSAYSLSLSDHVPMAKQIRQGRLLQLDEDKAALFMEMAHDKLESAGYEHYEISNYAKPGYQCQHNLIYWQGNSYLGLGASAHSFDSPRRWWNVADVAAYRSSLEKGQLPVEGEEELSETELELEKIALGLRTLSGVPLSLVWHAEKMIDQLIHDQKAVVENESLILTPAGFLIADEIAIQLAK